MRMGMIWWMSGWIVWCLVAWAALLGWAQMNAKATIKEPIYVGDGAQVLSLTLLTTWFYLIPEWDKLHLLWLAPLLFGVSSALKVPRKLASD